MRKHPRKPRLRGTHSSASRSNTILSLDELYSVGRRGNPQRVDLMEPNGQEDREQKLIDSTPANVLPDGDRDNSIGSANRIETKQDDRSHDHSHSASSYS